jgi:PAS domain S-box-containing protein
MVVMAIDEQYLERILDGVTDPLVLYDRSLRIVRVNYVVEELFQKPARDLLGKTCRDLFHADEEGFDTCLVKEVLLGGEPRMSEKLVRMPMGSSCHFEINYYPIRGANGKIDQVLEHARDISRRKLLQRELQLSEERYRTMVETAREGIYIIDKEGRFAFVNQRFAKMLGYQPDELPGRSVFDLLDDQAKALASEKLERRRQGFSDVYELRLIKKDGSPLDGLISVAALMENGVYSGSMGILTDISCLKRAESALVEAKAFNEKIINSITDPLAVIDPKTYQILQSNAAFLKRSGAADAAVLAGKTCHQALFARNSPCSREGIFCPVQETFLTKGPTHCDRTLYSPSGQQECFAVSTYPLTNDGGEVELVVRLERDVTEKEKMEKTLASRSSELHRIQNRLDKLFEISKQVGTKRSLAELLEYLYSVTAGIFPTSDPLFFILNAAGEQTLLLDNCDSRIAAPIKQLRGRLEECGLTSCFTHYLRKARASKLMASSEAHDIPAFLKLIAENYPSWFTLNICVQDQSVGLFFLGSRTFFDFKPEDLRFIHAVFGQAAGVLRHLVAYEAEISDLRQRVAEPSSCGDMIGKSRKMQEVYELIDLVAGSDATVLITGENGTGKELVAHAIHERSHRQRGPFVVANCSAYSQTLLESELFGHEKGSFTGAIRQKKGRIERAHEGTLFLDEIGDIAPATQILLLRFLQDHCIERVGGEKTLAADVRVLAATNRDLQKEAQLGRFRDDLYYRLNVISVHLPPLRERIEDTPLLAKHFLKRFALKEQKRILSFSSGAMQVLMDYDWPGNVRQLENAVSHAVVLCRGDCIRRKDLPRFLRDIAQEEALPTSLAENERLLILRALKEASGNKHDAARRLKVSRSTLYSKIRRHGLESELAHV